MASTYTFRFSVLLSLLLVSLLGVKAEVPQACSNYECPTYDVIEVKKDYEIRRYNSTVWISSDPIEDTSVVEATKTGVKRLFSYIHGNNSQKKEIKMTSPVATEVSNGSGGKSSYVVSFYVPKVNQGNIPTADGLSVQRWKTKYAVVKQFGGFVRESVVADQVNALKASIAGTKWSTKLPKSFTVAQYNAPFELFHRVNEIWFLYDSEN
ncbi:heme-binding protein 2 [Cajanus cajan]|uniref:Heme-binding protein 2 n=1 Tax=Cajanus cajan TaxID=3821 RepID=A0A151SA85_CAJCA|nr:heme-binding protein 2 [Cajanus cajan]KYP51649.1 Heme-binding protein 2 [Cajanus cajan]